MYNLHVRLPSLCFSPTYFRDALFSKCHDVWLQVVPGVVEALKVITAEKSKRIAEYAFEYAFMNRRKKVRGVCPDS